MGLSLDVAPIYQQGSITPPLFYPSAVDIRPYSLSRIVDLEWPGIDGGGDQLV
jgi:hypothetical protein